MRYLSGLAAAPCLLLLGAAGPGAEPAAAAPDIYILAGQSNMSGRGAIEELTAAERVADPGILVFGNDGMERVARDPIDDAAGQVDAVSEDRQAAVGPGLFFARAMRGRPILLVPCAKGGSSIGQWKPGGGRETLYGSCIARVKAAGGRVAGLLWYQGETDARSEAAAAGWSAAFRELVAAFRRDLGEARLPLVFVALADKPVKDAARYPGWEAVQVAQRGLVLPCARVVSAGGLPLKGDELHLTTGAQRVLGKRMAGAMMRVRRGCG